MLSVVILSVVMLSVVMLNVVMLSVVALHMDGRYMIQRESLAGLNNTKIKAFLQRIRKLSSLF